MIGIFDKVDNIAFDLDDNRNFLETFLPQPFDKTPRFRDAHAFGKENRHGTFKFNRARNKKPPAQNFPFFLVTD